MGRRFLHRRVLRSGAAAGAGAHQAQPRARGGARHQVQYSAVQYTVQYSIQYNTVQYSTVQLDTRALALLADSCTNLTTLGFYNCGFREPGAGAGAELLAADVAARRREQEEEAALALSCSWLDVERLTITSEVRGARGQSVFCIDLVNVLSDRSKAADCHHVHVS